MSNRDRGFGPAASAPSLAATASADPEIARGRPVRSGQLRRRALRLTMVVLASAVVATSFGVAAAGPRKYPAAAHVGSCGCPEDDLPLSQSHGVEPRP